jgi:serine phosphatase RsbU (regulator of sigma subunit)
MSEHKMIKTYVIEDDRLVVLLLKKMLPQWGYEVVGTSCDPNSIFEEVKELKPELLLVDIHLGNDITGIDVVKQLALKDDKAIIYLTGDLEDDTIAKAKDTYPIAYLKKPFEELQLKTILGITTPFFKKMKGKVSELNELQSLNEMQIAELNETNAHLITATFRERSLKKELENSNKLIEDQKRKIIDSINYALRIQQAIVPSDVDFAKHFEKYFCLYIPKDVVSGDFPWLMQFENYIYFAAIDCTGHGVPGAMMSMIGNLILNGIIQQSDNALTPSEVLLKLHQSVVSTLKQDAPDNTTADGMDAALCRLDLQKKELIFSGAHLPLQLLRKGEVQTFKGSKFPIGGMQYKNKNNYEDYIISLEKGDRIYIYSDGIVDQMGGEEDKKWKTSSLVNFIIENQNLSIQELKKVLYHTFNEYKGSTKQMDDVLVIGVEF